MVILGYSGHAFVVIDIFDSCGIVVTGYIDSQKDENPYMLKWLGKEGDLTVEKLLQSEEYFVSIGDNHIRERVTEKLLKSNGHNEPSIARHKNSIISKTAEIKSGTFIGAGVVINSMSRIGKGVILNTGCIVEHENIIGNYSHIAPGAVLAGNVTVGERSFIGANSVIIQGITIGDDVIVGAGAVVIRDVPSGSKVVGVPQKHI